MERVNSTDNILEVFENDIDMYLKLFKEEHEIEDLRAVPQSVWNGALRYIYNHVFKNNSDLLKSRNIYNLNNNSIPSNCNMYDYDLILELVDYYIYDMCMVNNKEVSILGFETLTGISQENIYNWGNNNNKLSSMGFKIYKKLTQMREESLSNKLVDGKQNPIGVIATLRRHYTGWDDKTIVKHESNKSVLTAAELPKLSDNTAQNGPALPQK